MIIYILNIILRDKEDMFLSVEVYKIINSNNYQDKVEITYICIVNFQKIEIYRDESCIEIVVIVDIDHLI